MFYWRVSHFSGEKVAALISLVIGCGKLSAIAFPVKAGDQCLLENVIVKYKTRLDRLLILQQRIKRRIEQAKNQIHESHNRAFIDSVLIEIDTFNWVLNEISQHSINREQLKKASS